MMSVSTEPRHNFNELHITTLIIMYIISFIFEHFIPSGPVFLIMKLLSSAAFMINLLQHILPRPTNLTSNQQITIEESEFIIPNMEEYGQAEIKNEEADSNSSRSSLLHHLVINDKFDAQRSFYENR